MNVLAVYQTSPSPLAIGLFGTSFDFKVNQAFLASLYTQDMYAHFEPDIPDVEPVDYKLFSAGIRLDWFLAEQISWRTDMGVTHMSLDSGDMSASQTGLQARANIAYSPL